MREMGLPTYEQYKGLRDMIANYTDGRLLLTTWRWAKGGVMPGDTAGLCVAQPEPSDAYYSCWSFSMNDDWQYQEMNSSYLIDPNMITADSQLQDFQDIGMGPFPAMYGGWMCIPPMEMLDMYYVDCMRFLPGAEYSNQTDMGFTDGPVRVMTYMSSRAGDGDTTTVDGNDRLV